jgi:hypothetical protein
MFNYIGIDPSLSSTAMTIRLTDGSIHYFNFKTTDKLTKWHKVLSYVKYVDFESNHIEKFSDSEIGKLMLYDNITDCVITEILALCEPEDTYVAIEGYSFSSRVGPLIDLVTFSTLLRHKLIDHKFAKLHIVPPASLKSATCLFVYGPGEKKKPSRNDEGIAGGRFQKREMLKALFDSYLVHPLKESASYHKEELLKAKAIPKPIDDITDSIFLCELLKIQAF